MSPKVYLKLLFCGGRGFNPELYIYYVLFLELNLNLTHLKKSFEKKNHLTKLFL